MERLALVFFMLIGPSQGHENFERPNIIVFVADDMGWNDASFHGSDEIPTPNIDALGYNGIIFDRHYSQQSCTPSRAALLTGQYPIRFGYQGFPMRPGEARTVPRNIATLPKSLKALGYSTHLLGKWHLGHGHANNTPLGYGYDEHYGYWNGFIGYFDHRIRDFNLDGIDFHNNLKSIKNETGNYFTDLLTKKALDVISKQPNDVPMHLVVSHLAPHTGKSVEDLVGYMEVKDINETNRKFAHIKTELRRMYADAVVNMDQSIGTIVKALDEKKMLDNSVIVFFSDNGGQTYGMFENGASNWPFRGLKMTLFDGGVRVPAVLYSPKLKNKGRIYRNLFHISDWAPTLITAAGGNASVLGKIDGIDQWNNLLNDLEVDARKEILLNIDEKAHYSGIMDTRYKLINNSFSQNIYDNFTGESGCGYASSELLGSVLNSDVNRALAKKRDARKAIKLRHEATVGNCRTGKRLDLRCTGKCLFDLLKDPCETTDVSRNKPEVVQRLWKRLREFEAELVPQQNGKVDPEADPARCDGAWFNWLDGALGCANSI